MSRVWLIALKDVRLILRDRAAVLLMLLAPLALILGAGLISGRLSGSGQSGPRDIPVVLVNRDDGELGNFLVQVFQSEELAGLVEPLLVEDPDLARRMVDEDRVAAAILIPQGFTQSVFMGAEGWEMWVPGGVTPAGVSVEFYTNPSRPNSVAILESILRNFLSRVEEIRISGITAVWLLIADGRIAPVEAEAVGRAVGEQLGEAGWDVLPLRLKRITGSQPTQEVDFMAYMAPGMALMFLMFTATYGAHSLLAERQKQTLQRMLVMPVSVGEVLTGKMIGIFLSGMVQQLVLIGSSTLFFGLRWGDPWGVLALLVCATFAAVGWGMFIAAFARTPAQAATAGSMLMLVFGLLGGSFVDLRAMSSQVYWLNRLTPNAWGLDGFSTLAAGGNLGQITQSLLALLLMGSALLGSAIFVMARFRDMKQ